MTARNRNILVWIGILSVSIMWMVLTFFLSNWFAVGLIGTLLIGRKILLGVVCPNCGVTLNPGPVTGMDRFRFPIGPLRRVCSNCGWDLSRHPVASQGGNPVHD